MSMPVLEHRRGGSAVLFVLVVVAHIILISAQVTSKSGMPVLQAVAFGLVAELQRGGAGAVNTVTSLWRGYVDLRGMRDENQRLRQQLADAQIRLQQERALAQRSGELTRLLDLRSGLGLVTTAAEVIAASATPDFRTVTIGKGTTSGLRPDMAVLSPEGVVGTIACASVSPNEGHLRGMAVLPQWQGSGVAEALLQAMYKGAEDIAKAIQPFLQ